jgi:ADP-heptose:LPS heptosyltransferase
VIIEPYVKNHHTFSQNKAWAIENWLELIKSIDLPWIQLGPPEAKALPGVRKINTRRFREAIPYLNKAKLVVTTDGGMHHTRAALGKDAVVMWGGLVPPTLLGYDLHKNIWHGVEPCGNRFICDHCRTAMDSITVEEVKEAIEERLNRTHPVEGEAATA